MSLSPPLPNFERADYEGAAPPPDQCAYCHRGITAEYYRVDGNLACPSCAQQAQSLIPPDSHKAYSRAVLFGIGAAIAACIGYSLVQMMGFMIGFVAIGVGWLVGTAMKKGSRGLGGRRYQITAAILTYAAPCLMAFVPRRNVSRIRSPIIERRLSRRLRLPRLPPLPRPGPQRQRPWSRRPDSAASSLQS